MPDLTIPGTRTCSSSATWLPSRVFRAWPRAPSRAASTRPTRSKPNSPGRSGGP
ncbi:putative nADH dehydrogenase [Mycobacterium xenopi 3993]|nr:putative nADH dehydrogenase [Mycobacterium xenopi 3993]